MESTPMGFKSNNGGKGCSALDKKPLGEKFGNKNVRYQVCLLTSIVSQSTKRSRLILNLQM